MRQLSRQNISRQLIGRIIYELEHLTFETKLVLVRFELRTFAVLGVFVTTRINVQETLQSLNSL